MTYAELDTLYRGARCPRSIAEFNGDTRGAMLVVAMAAHWSNRVVVANVWRFVRISVGRQNVRLLPGRL